MLNRWQNETVCIVCAGPSATVADAEHAGARARTIVVNESWRLLPSASVLYAADAKWWRHRAPPADAFHGERWTCDKHFKKGEQAELGLQVVTTQGGAGLADKPPIFTGSNSGFQALGLAVLWGVRRVVFIGLDLMYSEDGEHHWHGAHPQPLGTPTPKAFQVFKHAFESVAPALAERGVSVINASRRSALTCYPRMRIEDALP